MYVGMYVYHMFTICQNTRMLKVSFGQLKLTGDTRVIHFDYIYARAALAWTKKKRSLRNLKETELKKLKNRGNKG